MIKNKKIDYSGNLKNDFPASIVVFLVAVPLCLGIALASGAPLFSGIIAGIVGGIVVGALSGSSLGVSGPAAGLAVIVLSAINELGAYEIFLAAVVLGGIIQIILGIFKAGVIGYYFPSSVIKGMLSGIGIIIVLKQIPHAVGYDRIPEGQMDFVQPDGETTISELARITDFISTGPLIVALVSLFLLILWERPFIKRTPVLKLIPGPLLVVMLGMGLNLLFMGSSMAIRPDQLVTIPIANTMGEFFGLFTLPDFAGFLNPSVWVVACTLAVVASLETLLSVEATDKLDPEKRVTPTNRELKAQGIGNIISGMIGGLPVTQVIVRSSANIQSGGKTKVSAMIHGSLLLVSAIAIPTLLNLIPLASLAAVLFMVGYKLASPALIKSVYKKGLAQFIPFAVTVLGIVFTDLLTGIGMGMAVAVFQILRNNYKTPYVFHPEGYEPGEPVVIHLSEDVSFLNKAGIQRTLNELPDGCTVVIDGSNTRTIHPDVIEIIDDFRSNAATRGITLNFVGLGRMNHPDPVECLCNVVHQTQFQQKEEEVIHH